LWAIVKYWYFEDNHLLGVMPYSVVSIAASEECADFSTLKNDPVGCSDTLTLICLGRVTSHRSQSWYSIVRTSDLIYINWWWSDCFFILPLFKEVTNCISIHKNIMLQNIHIRWMLCIYIDTRKNLTFLVC
jgi:hypothetical protein